MQNCAFRMLTSPITVHLHISIITAQLVAFAIVPPADFTSFIMGLVPLLLSVRSRNHKIDFGVLV